MNRSFFDWVVLIIDQYGALLARGTMNTVIIAVVGTLVGFAIGLLVGIYRTIPISPRDSIIKRILYKCFNILLSIYIEVFRSTPMMVQAMVVFYGTAMVFGVHINPFIAGLIIISINTGAYMSEIVRGGILSIDNGQFEAAHSIGMTHSQTMIKIILPQAIRNIMPSVGNEFTINMKDSCVLSVIGVTELFFQTKSVAGAIFQFFPPFLVTSVIYFLLVFTMTQIVRAIERKMDGSDSYTIHGSQSVPQATIKVGREK